MKLENFIIRKVEQQLPIQLTEEEIKTRSVNSVKKLREINHVKEQFRIICDEWRTKIKSLQREFEELNIIIEREIELKEVDCERVFDIKKQTKWFVYRGVKYYEEYIDDKEMQTLRQGTIEDFTK
jgi:hypothetical protein